MADADRCVACGDIIPEGRQICPACGRKTITPPTIDEVKAAARVIKAFCNSRNANPETDCIECPIRDMCETDPYTWEV